MAFDRAFSEAAGFAFVLAPPAAASASTSSAADASPAPSAAPRLRSVRLVGMGPKLLVSDRTTADQAMVRWRLRVRGNTAVEFGVIPADLPVSPAWAGRGWVWLLPGCRGWCVRRWQVCAGVSAPACRPPFSPTTPPPPSHTVLQPTPTSLHKCMASPGCPDHRATGFCSQVLLVAGAVLCFVCASATLLSYLLAAV